MEQARPRFSAARRGTHEAGEEVTEIAIFYYSEFRELEPSDDRLTVAGINRVCPIAMMTFAAILALMPLTLIVLPTLLSIVGKGAHPVSRTQAASP